MASPVPGLPTGQVVGTYDTYADAQKAVDYLADQKFAVEQLAIVGSDLRQIERVTGRMTWAKAALSGLASGAWLGLFVGLLLGLFTNEGWGRIILFSVLWGAVFMLVFGLVGYALHRRPARLHLAERHDRRKVRDLLPAPARRPGPRPARQARPEDRLTTSGQWVTASCAA